MGLKGWVNGGLLLGSLLVGVLLLEGVLRILGPYYSSDLHQALLDRADDEDLYNFVPGVGTMTRPSLNRPGVRINDTESFTLKTDAEGFRNDLAATPGDIAFLGDSFVWGFGVDRAATWVAQLQALSHKTTQSYGQSGFSSWQYQQVFDRYVAPKKPRLVIWAFFANDLDPVSQKIQAQGRNGNELATGARVWLDPNSLIYRLVKFIIQRAYFSDQQPVHYQDPVADLVLFPITHSILNPQNASYQQGWQELQQGLKEVNGRCLQQGCQLVVTLIPTKEMVYLPRVGKVFTPEQKTLVENASATYRKLETYLGQEKVPYLDFTPAFQQAAQRAPQLYFRIDGHWSREGHRVAAETLEQFLTQRALLK